MKRLKRRGEESRDATSSGGDTSSTLMGVQQPSVLKGLERINGIEFTGNNLESRRQWEARVHRATNALELQLAMSKSKPT